MDYVFAAILIVEAVIAAYWGFESLMVPDRPMATKISVFLLGVFSFMWGSGMGMVCIADNFEHANQCRAVALLGAYGFISCFVYLVSSLSNIPIWFKRISKVCAACAIPLWFFVIRPEEVTFSKTTWGTTYFFAGTPVTVLHFVYSIVMGCIAFHYCLSLTRFGSEKSKRALGKQLFEVGGVFVVGVLLDTALTITIPGSAICQFFTFALLVRAVMEDEECKPTQSNVSTFIYSTLSVPICMYDGDEKLYYSNEAADSFTGSKATQSLATVLDFAIMFGLEKSQLLQFEGKRIEHQAVCSLNGRDCIVHVDKIENRYSDVIGYMMSVDDISDQVALMRNIENQHQIKSNFLTNLAQEIRTPMNSIVGFTETMLKGDITEEQRESLENIRVASYTTVETINEILDFSKVEAGKLSLMKEAYDMGKLLASTIRQVQVPVGQKKLEFVAEIDETIPTILEGDVARLREIFYSLVKNAIKYTQEGTITLRVKLLEVVDGNANIQIEVKDTGIGLHEGDLDAVFSPYEKLDSSQYSGMEV